MVQAQHARDCGLRSRRRLPLRANGMRIQRLELLGKNTHLWAWEGEAGL